MGRTRSTSRAMGGKGAASHLIRVGHATMTLRTWSCVSPRRRSSRSRGPMTSVVLYDQLSPGRFSLERMTTSCDIQSEESFGRVEAGLFAWRYAGIGGGQAAGGSVAHLSLVDSHAQLGHQQIDRLGAIFVEASHERLLPLHAVRRPRAPLLTTCPVSRSRLLWRALGRLGRRTSHLHPSCPLRSPAVIEESDSRSRTRFHLIPVNKTTRRSHLAIIQQFNGNVEHIFSGK